MQGHIAPGLEVVIITHIPTPLAKLSYLPYVIEGKKGHAGYFEPSGNVKHI